MATASPPKPWEMNRGQSSAITSLAASSSSAPSATTTTTAIPSSTTTTSGAPAIPSRPSSLSSVVNRTASNYTTPTTSTASTFNRPYGSSLGYGSSYSSPYGYSSPYSRFGGGSMYGGGMYGGGMYGGGMYGGGMYGGSGMMGPMGYDPNDPNSMTNSLTQSTQATFQIIESIVGAFGGFAQMLESTYMATHSSFFAMVSVAEQFGNLRQTIGSILGIYTLLRWLRTLIAKVTGRPPPADATALTPASFAAFQSGTAPPAAVGPDGRPIPRPSKKPFIVFMLAVFGLPYLMGKLIRALAKSQEEAQQQQNQNHQQLFGPDGQPLPPNQQPQPSMTDLDPSKLDFCRALYDFPPPDAVASGQFDSGLDLSVKKGDLVAVLDKTDPSNPDATAESAWWRCRARDGRMGYLPAVYLETIQRRPGAAQREITANAADGRANSMPASVSDGTNAAAATLKGGSAPGSRAQTLTSSRASSLKTANVTNGKDQGSPEGLEKFQKAWVNER